MNNINMEYKYDFELSSKRRTCLWLYQILPNIDIIKEIYRLKEQLELEENQIYHGLCPRNVITMGAWIPPHISDSRNIQYLQHRLSKSAELMKYIVEDGFICEFIMNKEDYTVGQIEQIEIGNWITIIPDLFINEKPSYRQRIKVMNYIHEETPPSLFYFFKKIDRIFKLFKHTYGINIYRIGIDQNKEIYIPHIYV